MRLDRDKIQDSLCIDDIKKILGELGSKEPDRDKQGNLIFSTVCHGGDKHKLYYYEDSKLFHCYTDCGESFNIFDLVIKVKNCSFPQAIEYVARTSGKTFGFGSSNLENVNMIDDWNWLNRFQKEEKKNIELPCFNKNVLDVFLTLPHEEWINEGISYDTLQKFNVGYYLREERITIPHFDIDNNLIGIRGRATKQEDIDNNRKYMPLIVGNTSYAYPSMFNLYGLHKTKDAVKRLRKAAIFEGEKSVFKCEDYYGNNNFSCGVSGSNISKWQRDILLNLGVEEVFIAFDKFRAKKEDESEEKYKQQLEDYQEKLIKLAKIFTPFCRTYILYDEQGLLYHNDSPADKGKEILEILMKNKIEISTINGV